jgi:hypothetical protein
MMPWIKYVKEKLPIDTLLLFEVVTPRGLEYHTGVVHTRRVVIIGNRFDFDYKEIRQYRDLTKFLPNGG